MAKFPGFPIGLVHFLDALARNNTKPWFEKNRARYESEVREPALAFIRAMQGPLATVSPHFVAVDKKVGGSLMRVHRDVRFSNDKTPYKTNVGIHFRHERGKDVHAPGFYLHIEPEEVFLGAGIWHPDPAALGAIRKAIDTRPDAYLKALGAASFRKDYEPGGESLKRPPKGYDAQHPLVEHLKRKDHIGACQLPIDDLFKPTVVKTVTAKFQAAAPYVGFLCHAIGLKF
ncbi:hypothetical protein Pla175_44850 [Pirellulimonas nuda]|uniref:TIGR02453 family protein n=1 Tax=Pirellulimonas nuda TaxID=2528009 RepID=A0A518DHV7_9BACT|nr:DUF2461 domain-containing protein [Pirellulimonas nuda]QDU91068.1 hypothetical protein Pla175_44850 [Pirellulimonas nuda]